MLCPHGLAQGRNDETQHDETSFFLDQRCAFLGLSKLAGTMKPSTMKPNPLKTSTMKQIEEPNKTVRGTPIKSNLMK
jgi:hypothetical protein